MADRLTDAELLRLHTSFCQFSPNATDKALTELIERRAMDAEIIEKLESADTALASIGYPADASGKYHKDGEWTFDDAVPDHVNRTQIEAAFMELRSVLSIIKASA